MGAGNYYFQAPAGDSWSKMIYVDLQPITWSDEQERRRKEFDEFLKNDRRADNVLLAAARDSTIEHDIEEQRELWLEEHYPYVSDEREFCEDQAEQQRGDILAALCEAFPNSSFELGNRYAETIADATVIGEVDRMAIAAAYTYYGNDLALIVTPRSSLQDTIWSIENGGFEFERNWHTWQRDALRKENARLAGIKRSVESGALGREMQKVFDRMVLALHDYGLADSMWFRSCAWTGKSYCATDLYQSNAARLSRRKRSPARLAVGSHQVAA